MNTPYQIITLALVADIFICYCVKIYCTADAPDNGAFIVNIILMITIMYQLLRLYILSLRICRINR